MSRSLSLRASTFPGTSKCIYEILFHSSLFSSFFGFSALERIYEI
jgi:hypothetical protein